MQTDTDTAVQEYRRRVLTRIDKLKERCDDEKHMTIDCPSCNRIEEASAIVRYTLY